MDENNTQANEISSSRGLKLQIANFPAIPFIGGIVVVLIVIVIAFYVLSNKPNPEAVKLVESGNAALKKSDYSKAQEDFQKALGFNKNDPVAQTGLINAYSLEGNSEGTEKEQLEKSKEVIEQSLKSHSNDTDLLTAAGYAYETAGEYERALEYYKKATEIAPNSSNAWFHLGHVYQFLGNKDESKKAYDKSYQLDPKNPMVNMIRGNDYFSEQKFDDAYNSFKTAANNSDISNSIKAEALTGAATVLLNRDNFAYIVQADAIAKQAVETDPSFSPALGLYGSTQFLRGNDDVAISYLERAIEANPKIAKNYYYLAMVQNTQNNYTEAIDNLKSAILAIDSDNTIFTQAAKTYNKGLYYYNLAKIYEKSGASNQEVLSSLQTALNLAPQLKDRLKVETKYSSVFSQIAGTSEFQSLIN